MALTLSNAAQYAKQWRVESEHLESHGVYQRLAKLAPQGTFLEFGSGIGNGTRQLSAIGSVLSLEGNPDLLANACAVLAGVGNVTLHQCDFFNLTAEDKAKVQEFSPSVIIGWFIGSHGGDIYKHTAEEKNPAGKSKLYREKVEDILVSADVCLPSVQHIHLVNRGGRVAGFTEEQYFAETKADYDKFVFAGSGFRVQRVEIFDWPTQGSKFLYGQAPNPNLARGESTPSIVSIIASRQ